MKLTEHKIETLEVGAGRKDRLVFDDAQRGLAVRVTASGGRNYLCQYTLHGQKWRVPLGACSALSLAKAREAAAAIMGDVAKGRNPAAERKDAAAAERAKRVRDRLTLRVLIDEWRRLHLTGRRASYAAEAVRALHFAFAKVLDDAAEDLDRATIVRTLDALTRRGKRKDGEGAKPRGAAMVGRTAAYGRAAFAWAVKRGMVHVNPFAHLPVAKSIAKRERVLTDSEIGDGPESIVGPARENLCDRVSTRAPIMQDAPKEDALPLLAFALQRLWRQYAASGTLTKDNYDKVGGLTGMIEDAAERALRGIEPEQDVPLPSASPPKRLIELGALTFVPALAQVNEQGATIRRVVKWQSFNDEQQELLARFDRWRLVVRKGEADGGTVEVAHEALFREWTRLNGWLEPERARLDALRSLEVDTATWDRNGQDAAFLNHRDKRLAEANALADIEGYRKRLERIDKNSVDLDAVALCGLLDHTVEAKDRDCAQVVSAGPQVLEAAVALELRKTVGADRESELPPAVRRGQSDAQVVGQSIAAAAVGARHFLSLIDADEDRRAGVARGCAELLRFGVERPFQRGKAGSR